MARRTFGWIRDEPDDRDVRYFASPIVTAALPDEVSGKAKSTVPAFNQQTIGCCGPNAIGRDILFDAMLSLVTPDIMPSRMQIYWCTRAMMGTIYQDSGVSIRTMFKSLAVDGGCDERLWPYIPSKLTVRPSDEALADAKTRKLGSYQRVYQQIDQMCGCLASDDPFVAGFMVKPSFLTPQVEQTGDVLMPQPGEQTIGGHAILITGYSMRDKMFEFCNSYGPGWGNQGWGRIPFAYLLDPNLSSDFWTARWATHDPAPQPVPPAPTPPGPIGEEVWDLMWANWSMHASGPGTIRRNGKLQKVSDA